MRFEPSASSCITKAFLAPIRIAQPQPDLPQSGIASCAVAQPDSAIRGRVDAGDEVMTESRY